MKMFDLLKIAVSSIVVMFLSYNFYVTRKLVTFAKETANWSEFKQAEIKCINEKLSYLDNTAYTLQKRITRKQQRDWFKKEGVEGFGDSWIYAESHGGYHDWLPSCKIYYTQFACWELDTKNDKSIDKCASNFGFDLEETKTLKKTHKYFDPKKYNKQ